MNFPAKVEISGSVMEKWRDYEHPSYEDSGKSEDHVYALLQRYKTRVEVRDQEEYQTVMKSLKHWKEGIGQMAFANKQTEAALQEVHSSLEEEVSQE